MRSYKLDEFAAHAERVNCLRLGRNSAGVLATGGEDRKVNLWKVGSPHVARSLSALQSPVECVTFDASENQVAAGGANGTVKIWDLESGKVCRSLTGHRSNCLALEFHPFGPFVATGSADTNVKVWDLRRKEAVATLKGHTGRVRRLAISPDGKWVCSGSENGEVKLWDVQQGRLVKDGWGHDGGAVTGLEFHPSEFVLATSGMDRTVRVWDLEAWRPVEVLGPEATGVRAIAYHRDGRELLAATGDALKVWGVEPAVVQHDAVPVDWRSLADMHVSYLDDVPRLVGCCAAGCAVGVFVVDLRKVAPFCGGGGGGGSTRSGSVAVGSGGAGLAARAPQQQQQVPQLRLLHEQQQPPIPLPARPVAPQRQQVPAAAYDDADAPDAAPSSRQLGGTSGGVVGGVDRAAAALAKLGLGPAAAVQDGSGAHPLLQPGQLSPAGDALSSQRLLRQQQQQQQHSYLAPTASSRRRDAARAAAAAAAAAAAGRGDGDDDAALATGAGFFPEFEIRVPAGPPPPRLAAAAPAASLHGPAPSLASLQPQPQPQYQQQPPHPPAAAIAASSSSASISSAAAGGSAPASRASSLAAAAVGGAGGGSGGSSRASSRRPSGLDADAAEAAAAAAAAAAPRPRSAGAPAAALPAAVPPPAPAVAPQQQQQPALSSLPPAPPLPLQPTAAPPAELPQQPQPQQQEEEPPLTLDAVMARHPTLAADLRRQLAAVQLAKAFVDKGNFDAAFRAVLSHNDPALAAMVLEALQHRADAFALGCCEPLAQLVGLLLGGASEFQAGVGLASLQLLLRGPGRVARDVLAAPAPVGVDLQYEARRAKCQALRAALERLAGPVVALALHGGSAMLAARAQAVEADLQAVLHASALASSRAHGGGGGGGGGVGGLRARASGGRGAQRLFR